MTEVLIARVGRDGHDRGGTMIASAFADTFTDNGFDVLGGPQLQVAE